MQLYPYRLRRILLAPRSRQAHESRLLAARQHCGFAPEIDLDAALDECIDLDVVEEATVCLSVLLREGLWACVRSPNRYSERHGAVFVPGDAWGGAMSTGLGEATQNNAVKRPNRLLIAFVTLALISGVLTVTQVATWAAAGMPMEFAGGWSPGAFAIICAGWMSAACKSWAAWKKWIWIPVIAGVVLSVALVLLVASGERATEEQSIRADAQQCNDARSELTRLTESHDALVASAGELYPAPVRSADWVPSEPSSTGPRDLTGGAARAWEYYLSNSGPQLASDIESLDKAIAQECTE